MSDDESTAIWGLDDYAVYVPLSDKFYNNLNFNRISRDEFDSGSYRGQPPYPDSRTYMRPLLRLFTSHCGGPADVLDVGGYIGRFTIETALLCRELGTENRILCFEPGETRDLLRRNLTLNGMEKRVDVLPYAVSARRGEATFAIKDDAKITSRIVANERSARSALGPQWSYRTVETVPLSEILEPLREQAESRSMTSYGFICKIDTEGHEADVIAGLGDRFLDAVPHALIIEFWPVLRSKKIRGEPFERFVFDRYDVYDIRSSLYPKGFEKLSDFSRVVRRIESKKVNNLDLLLVSKLLPPFSSASSEIA